MAAEKIKTAVSLKYDQGSAPVPMVTAAGKGRAAERIVELAKENKIPIQKNPMLAESLSALQIGEEIPPDLYQAVAQILVYIMHADKILGESE